MFRDDTVPSWSRAWWYLPLMLLAVLCTCHFDNYCYCTEYILLCSQLL
jgi:hypothetical protein